MKTQQSSASSARYHLKTKQALDSAKITKLTAEQEEKRADDLKEIQEKKNTWVRLKIKCPSTPYFYMTSKGYRRSKSLAKFDLGKYPSQHQWQLEADLEIMKFIA